MEAPVDVQLRFDQPRRDIEFMPHVLGATGKHCFCATVVAVQVLCERLDALEVWTRAAVFSLSLGQSKSVPYQILDENGFAAMRFVLRRWRLIIERDCAT